MYLVDNSRMLPDVGHEITPRLPEHINDAPRGRPTAS
jgi:hypothetical protein